MCIALEQALDKNTKKGSSVCTAILAQCVNTKFARENMII